MRSTIAEVNQKNLRHNINCLKELIGNVSIMAIVKANGYGHGIVEVSKIFRDEGIEFLGVAYTNEGIALRNAGDKKPIVVLVPAFADEAPVFCEYDLQPVASSLDFVYALNEEAAKRNMVIKTHLFIGTGMNREGIQPDDAIYFMDECSKMKNVEMIGVCTHFASSSSDREFTMKQLRRFIETLDKMKTAGYDFQYKHAANSGAVLNFPESWFNIVRPGSILYGYSPTNGHPLMDGAVKLDLKPVLSIKSKVILSRRVKKGEAVSYDRLFIAGKPTNIVTIPIGYGDGYFKTLTGKAECLINGKRYNIVGAICMDECMADVGDDEVNPGDEVVLVGSQGNESIWAEEVAQKAGTIHYEVLTSVSARVPRVVI